MTIVRLWTFQSASIAPRLEAGRRHVAQRLPDDHNFRLAYDWMTERLGKSLNVELDAPPIWCWHPCGRWRRRPRVGTATSLLSDYDLEQSMVILELAVPAGMTLLSSYHAWNRLLDTTIVRRRLPHSRRWDSYVFSRPFRYMRRGDDVQAVIPWIEPTWVRRIAPLVVRGRDDRELV